MSLIRTKSFEVAAFIKGDINSKKLALVLPGRLDTKDYPNMKSHVEYLAGRGYLALSFDPPGTWESPGDISLYTMTNYLKAINELIEHFGNRPTLTLGHSRGGSMAMLSAINNQYITHFVSIFGQYSYASRNSESLERKKWRETGFMVHKRDTPGDSNSIRAFSLPYGFHEDEVQYDMSAGLTKCVKPKLFVFGTSDTTATPETVKTAFELSELPRELREIDSDHNYRLVPKLIEEVNTLVGEFLDKYA